MLDFSGIHTALVTPFSPDGSTIDETALRRIIDHQFAHGVSGVVAVGTTGESPTLSFEEHKRVIEITVEQAAGRGLAIAGTGSNATEEAIMLTKFAESAGADASLQVVPYYNKPSQEGLYQHFKAIADTTSLAIMLYSIPGRCGTALAVETVARLAASCPNIRSIKEAGGSVDRVSQLRANLPDDFQILSGDDGLALAFMSAGARGVVSVAGNLIPRVMADLTAAAISGDFSQAREIHEQYYPLFSTLLQLDTNPVAIKEAMHLAGFCHPALRLPMVRLQEKNQQKLKSIMSDLGLF